MYDRSQLYYELHGNPKCEKTLVFLHGVNGNLTTWHYFVQKFKKKYSILLIDLRGHGKSPYGGTKLGEYVKDVTYVLEKSRVLKTKKLILVGNSFGAIVALEFYRTYPQHVIQMQLMNVSGINTLRFPITTFLLNGAFQILNFILRLLRLDKLTPPDKDFSKLYKEGLSFVERFKICFTTNSDLYMRLSAKTISYRYSFRNVTCSTVLLSPQFDVLVSLEKLARLVNSRNISLAIVRGTDHLMITKAPDKVCKVLQEMIV